MKNTPTRTASSKRSGQKVTQNTPIKKAISSNTFFCIALTLFVLAGMLLEFYPFRALECHVYDLMMTLRHKQEANRLVLVEIDERSLDEIGPWPWPRSYIARVVQRISESSPKALGIYLLFSDREHNAGLTEIKDIRNTLQTNKIISRRRDASKVYAILAKSERELDHDARLLSAVNTAVNVVLPVLFNLGPQHSKNIHPLSTKLKRNSLNRLIPLPDQRERLLHVIGLTPGQAKKVPRAKEIIPTYGDLARRASALGHINIIPDTDGKVRSLPLFIQYKGRYFPSFALQLAAKYVGARLNDLTPINGSNGSGALHLGSLTIPADSGYRMLIDYNDGRTQHETLSFSSVLNGDFERNVFRKKIVLLGVAAERISHRYQTPLHAAAPEIEIVAVALENIVSGRHVARPSWAFPLEAMVVIYLCVFLVFVIPRVRPRVGAFILGSFIVTWTGTMVLVFLEYGYWLWVFPCFLVAVPGYGFFVFKRSSEKLRDETVEANKALGLSFQGQGMLDMAFEKFLKCPVKNSSVRQSLYNLGLDFERKRMLNKAVAVYEHIGKAGGFKDVHERIVRLKDAGETVILPPKAKKKGAGLAKPALSKPTLGRYEILKELGQGAMGTVYLGKDHKINREVAIKTLRYGDVESDQLEEVKTRFFLEAEAVGKLSHPNIVTIFDVGEDHDMAYMAMELLKGAELAEYCRKDNLLPVDRVLRIASSVADALSYAHSCGVVHRDIKPANVILLENDQVKVTDFGIARVLNISETQTGVVLGTPGYMSPEQVGGKKVDGRSDLFSLGVVCYELLTGEKPFKGENIAAVMYAIAKSPYQPIKKIVPTIPRCSAQIVDRLLTKGVSKRLGPASKVVKEIDKCLSKLG
jgi:CHASE2 domain-containing sensor protein/tRNA A-37 threonylcarbamoyl transferase component Bud32